MYILGIDTSCDDTAVALLKAENQDIKIVNNIVSSQIKLHEQYGGVYPFLAKREHQKNLPIIFKTAIKTIRISDIDLIGVTGGPGLEPCLWTGFNFAKELSEKLKKSLFAVNHIEAHILANWLPKRSDRKKLERKKLFPAICLVVSGGHTQLILMKKIGVYKILGETRDDAAGECLDKAARILGLGYPGGPLIAAEAAKYSRVSKFKISLPRPMLNQKNYDFSFSGLKTAVLYDFKRRSLEERKSKEYIGEMCWAVQQAVIDVLIKKTIKSVKDYRVKSLILGGGVVANEQLRNQLKKRVEKDLPQLDCLIPDLQYCTDNAAMIALTAYFHWLRNKKPNLASIINANLSI